MWNFHRFPRTVVIQQENEIPVNVQQDSCSNLAIIFVRVYKSMTAFKRGACSMAQYTKNLDKTLFFILAFFVSKAASRFLSECFNKGPPVCVF